jgi:hypothetical protein
MAETDEAVARALQEAANEPGGGGEGEGGEEGGRAAESRDSGGLTDRSDRSNEPSEQSKLKFEMRGSICMDPVSLRPLVSPVRIPAI